MAASAYEHEIGETKFVHHVSYWNAPDYWAIECPFLLLQMGHSFKLTFSAIYTSMTAITAYKIHHYLQHPTVRTLQPLSYVLISSIYKFFRIRAICKFLCLSYLRTSVRSSCFFIRYLWLSNTDKKPASATNQIMITCDIYYILASSIPLPHDVVF